MATRFVRNSETSVWRDCLLKWYFSHYLGFLTNTVNPNFWLGTLIHQALSEWYLGNVEHPEHYFWWLAEMSIEQERGARILIDGDDFDMDSLSSLRAYRDMGVVMLEGYVEWAEKNDDFDVIDTEVAYYIDLENHDGESFTFVGRFDLLCENSDGIWVRDFKTAKDFRATETVSQDSQFRRYPWMVAEAHPQWAEDIRGSVWVGLRKIVPSGRSKPPYFESYPIELTSEELAGTKREVVAEVTSIMRTESELNSGANPDDLIYPSPTYDCAWKCNFFRNGMCESWRAGLAVSEYGRSFGSCGNDPYAEYKEDFENAVPTIGRREGGE